MEATVDGSGGIALRRSVQAMHTRPAPVAGASQGRVQHIALQWFREPGDAGDREAWAERVTELATVPGVEAATAGPAAPVSWTEPDAGFDLAMTIVFEGRSAMEEYQTHPIHLTAIELARRTTERFYACYVDLDHPRTSVVIG